MSATSPLQPRPRRVSKLGVAIVGALVVVMLGVTGAVVAIVGSSDGAGGGGPFGNPDELEAAWVVDADAISASYGSFGSPEGTLTAPALTTPEGWVTMVEPSSPDAVLTSVDPETGEMQWTAGMPEGRCTQTEPGVNLLCLSRPGGSSSFQLLGVDTATGDTVGDRIAVDLGEVPAMVTRLGDGLVVLTMAGTLAGIEMDGTVSWSQPIGFADLDLSYQRVDVAHYEESVLLFLGWTVGTTHVTAHGEVTNHDCHAVVATEQAWICETMDDDVTVGRAPDGTELWRGPWQDYYLVVEYERIAPVAIVDNWDGTVSGVDPMTGERGPAVSVGDGSDNLSLLGGSVAGEATEPVITTDDAVLMLDTEVTTVLWEQRVSDEYLNIATGGVVGDQVVLDGELSYGFDRSAGEILWERDSLASDVWVSEDTLLGYSYDEFIRYELP